MRLIARFTAIAVVLALSLASAPRSSQAGTGSPPTAKNCFFVRNHLPCPCPSGRQAKAVARAARVTVGAVGSAIGTTVTALARADRASADPRNASQPTQAPKR